MFNGFYLTLMMGSGSLLPVPRAVIEALTDVQVTSAAGSKSGFQLSFTLGKTSTLHTEMLPSGFFDPRTRVVIIATVRGTPHVLMDGVITRQEVSPASDAGQSKLTVTGEDLSVLMDFVDFTGFPFRNAPPSTRVLVILGKYAVYGILPQVLPDPVMFAKDQTRGIDVQTGTDLSYINQLADETGYVFYIEPGPAPLTSTAYWGPEVRAGLPQPTLSVNMDATDNVASLSFSLDGLMRRQLLVTVQDENTKYPIRIPVPDPDVLKPPLAVRKPPALKTEIVEGAAKMTFPEATRKALGLMGRSADMVSGSGQLDVVRYGHVLKPRRHVAVRGAGRNYDGLYYVTSVTHNIQRGEYSQSFSLVRGGLGSTIERVSA